MKKSIKFLISLIVLIAIYLMGYKVCGASSYVSVSKSSVNVGDTFTVSIAGNAASWNVKLTYSGPVALVSGSTSDANATSSGENANTTFTTATFRATGEGKATFSVSGQLVNSDYSSINAGGSKTVSIIKPSSNSGGNSSGGSSNNNKPSGGGNTSKPNNNTTTPTEKEKSKDSTLSALTVKEGTITPEFKKDVKEYALTIPYETSEVNVTATPTDSKATVAVEGNKDLKEGENTVTVKVTAEDGSTSNYVIKVTRKRVPVALKSLVVKYENQEGELIELPLTPAFSFDKLEYTLEDLEHWGGKLSIEAIPNIEGATVDIQGADNLQTGENTITITVKIKAEDAKDIKEGEEPKEETITYTIKVNKKEEPTLIAKIGTWFNGTFGAVSEWYNTNTEKIILGALGVCVVALIGLSVYIIVDHNRYKDVIAKAKIERKANKLNITNVSENIIEEIHKDSNDTKKDNIDSDKNDKPKGGKHF